MTLLLWLPIAASPPVSYAGGPSIVLAVKITRIETLPLPMGYRDFLACRVHTDEGLVGIGEPYPVGPNEAVAAVIADFEGWLLGRDPRDISGIWQHLYAHDRFPGGSVVNAAISGIEHALWDISGKAAGVPVYRLLGGRCRERIRVYQSCGGATPEACAESALRLVERYGYTALKLSPHPPHAEALPWPAVVRGAAARLAAVRDAVGPDVEIGLDPHARIFEPAKALQMAEALRPVQPLLPGGAPATGERGGPGGLQARLPRPGGHGRDAVHHLRLP